MKLYRVPWAGPQKPMLIAGRDWSCPNRTAVPKGTTHKDLLELKTPAERDGPGRKNPFAISTFNKHFQRLAYYLSDWDQVLYPSLFPKDLSEILFFSWLWQCQLGIAVCRVNFGPFNWWKVAVCICLKSSIYMFLERQHTSLNICKLEELWRQITKNTVRHGFESSWEF